jgi:hypothetical protein
MAYTALGTVTTATVITKTWGDQVNTNLEAVKPRQISLYPHAFSGVSAEDSHGFHHAYHVGDATSQGTLDFDDFLIPPDFAVLQSAVVRCVSQQSGVLCYQTYSWLDPVGGVLNSGTTISNASGFVNLAVTSQVQFEIDISSLFTGIHSNYLMGIRFQRDGTSVSDTITNFYVFGAFILYTP